MSRKGAVPFFGIEALGLTFRNLAKLFGSHRKLWIPFLAVAFVEAFFVLLIWLAPHPPFSTLLAPPIRYFSGDRMLHYPWHLWFLYRSMRRTHLVTATLIGAFLSGVACAMVAQTHAGQPLSLYRALISKQVRYGRLLILWLVTWALATGVEKILTWSGAASWVIVGASVFVQFLFIYAIPAAVFENSKWWRALWRGAREAFRYPFSTLSVIVAPIAALIAFFALVASPAHVMRWMEQVAPEVVMVFILMRLLILTGIDAFLTVGVAHLWWAHRAARTTASTEMLLRTISSTSHQAQALAAAGWSHPERFASQSEAYGVGAKSFAEGV